jgi:hypothetical protein
MATGLSVSKAKHDHPPLREMKQGGTKKDTGQRGKKSVDSEHLEALG